jgi:hypothetical protein
LQSLYARAVLLDRPAVAVSFANLIDDYRRAELAKYKDEYVPVITPTNLATRSDMWFAMPIDSIMIVVRTLGIGCSNRWRRLRYYERTVISVTVYGGNYRAFREQ